MQFYRYDWDLVLRVFNLVKETQCGYWIEIELGKNKWVSKTSVKRFAYPTKREALNSFIARKKRQTELLRYQLKDAEHWWKEASKMKQLGEEQYRKSKPPSFWWPEDTVLGRR